MLTSMKQEQGVTTVDVHESFSYNSRALIRCEAAYLGASLPTKTTQPPGIIHEPLEKICEKENLPTLINPPTKRVRLHVFHSGIVIEVLFGKRNGELVWYPIQNLYCSAGIQPFKTKHGTFEFRSLEDQADTKSTLKPLFSVVFRESVHKKVLQCHAFAVARKELAQLLVQATAVAYRDKNGWNQPLRSSLFSNNEYNYTLNIVDEVHADSGYSDHDDSSQKSSQSPQSSELSTEIGSRQHLDNQKLQEQNVLVNTPSSSTTSLATSRDTVMNSIGYQSPFRRSPTNSGTLVGFNDTQEERHSGDEQGSCRSIKGSSISSGYPLSRNSSSIAPLPIPQQHNPHVVLVESPRPRSGKHYSAFGRSRAVDGNSFHGFSGRQSDMSLDSFDTLSLEQPPSNSKRKGDSKLKRSKTAPPLKPINSGFPAHLVQRQSSNISGHQPWSSQSSGSTGQVYGEPTYVSYHPEQFMYEGDNYLPNIVRVNSSNAVQGKERHKPSKDSKKVRFSHSAVFFTIMDIVFRLIPYSKLADVSKKAH